MVYIDLVIIQDIIYNYVILLGVSTLLKRITNFKKIFLASVIGIIPLISIFFELNNLITLLFSFIFSLIMSIITFTYKDILYTIKNIFYMYAISIFLAGSINLININLLPQINNSLIYVIVLLIIAPIITYIYVKSIKTFKESYSNYYKVDIYINSDEIMTLTAFLDTGNKLIDPYKCRPIILVNKSLINLKDKKIILVPYQTLNNNDLLKCFSPLKIYIHNIGYKKNFLIGLMDEINIEGVDCILNPKLLN